MEEGHGGGAWCALGDERERVDGRRKGIGHGALLAAQRGETGERGSDRLGLEQWAAGGLGQMDQRGRLGGPRGQWCRPGQGCRPPLSLNISLFPFKKKTEKRRKRKRRLGWKLGMGIILRDSQK